MDFTFLSHPLFIVTAIIAILELYFFAHDRYIEDVCSKHSYNNKVLKELIVTNTYRVLMIIILGIGFILTIATFFVFSWKVGLLIAVAKFLFFSMIPVPNKLLYPKTTKMFETIFSSETDKDR